MIKDKKIGISIISALILILFLGIPLCINRFFRLKKVIIISAVSDFKGLNLLEDKNLLFINEKRTAKLFLKENYILKDVTVKKEYPDKLIIVGQLRKPIAELAGNSANLFVDSEGVIIQGDTERKDLPTIEFIDKPLISGQKSDWRLIKTADFIEQMSKQSILIVRIRIDNNGNIFTVYMGEGEEIVIPFSSDIKVVAASLQVIISRFRIEGKFITKVDFRFDKPVVTLANGK